MNKKLIVGSVAAVALIAVLAVGIYATVWDMPNDTPQPIPFDPTPDPSGHISHNSLNYQIFEHYGPLLLVLALLMFGAMVGGICVAREEIEKIEENDKEVKE